MNTVKLSGTLTRVSTGKSEKGPWAFGTIQPEGEPGRFNLSAFDEAADVLASLGEGASIALTGRLWRKQNKKTEQWETIVRVDEVVEP